jgi:hypothetical protein
MSTNYYLVSIAKEKNIQDIVKKIELNKDELVLIQNQLNKFTNKITNSNDLSIEVSVQS